MCFVGNGGRNRMVNLFISLRFVLATLTLVVSMLLVGCSSFIASVNAGDFVRFVLGGTSTA